MLRIQYECAERTFAIPSNAVKNNSVAHNL